MRRFMTKTLIAAILASSSAAGIAGTVRPGDALVSQSKAVSAMSALRASPQTTDASAYRGGGGAGVAVGFGIALIIAFIFLLDDDDATSP